MIQLLIAILLLIAYLTYPAVAGLISLILAFLLVIGFLIKFMDKNALNFGLGILVFGLIINVYSKSSLFKETEKGIESNLISFGQIVNALPKIGYTMLGIGLIVVIVAFIIEKKKQSLTKNENEDV